MNYRRGDCFGGNGWVIPVLFGLSSTGMLCGQGLADRGYFTVDVGAAFLQEADSGNLDLEGALDTLPGFNPSDGIEFDPGIRVGLMGGYRLSEAWSVEFETGVIWNSVDSLAGVETGSSLSGVTPDANIEATWYDGADLYQIPLLLNLQYNFAFAQRWSAYISGGAGGVLGIFGLGDATSRVSGDSVFEETNRDGDTDLDLVFGYQAKAGVRYALNPESDIDLSYKFLGTLGYEWDLDGDRLGTHPLRNHAISLSYTLRF